MDVTHFAELFIGLKVTDSQFFRFYNYLVIFIIPVYNLKSYEYFRFYGWVFVELKS